MKPLFGLGSVGDRSRARAEAVFIAIPIDMVVRPRRLHSPMKLKAPSSFVALICVIVMLLTPGLSSVVSAQPAAQEDSPAELRQRIHELYEQGKYEEAIPLAEKLVVLTKKVKGEEDPETATSLNNLAELYKAMGDYAKAEPLLKEALEIYQKVLGREHPFTATSLNNLAALYYEMGDYQEPNRCSKRLWKFARKSWAGSIPLRLKA